MPSLIPNPTQSASQFPTNFQRNWPFHPFDTYLNSISSPFHGDLQVFLSVLEVGSPKHRRSIISNQEGRFWDGQNWTKDQSKALLFLEWDRDLGQATEKILRGESKGMNVAQIFEVPLILEVKSEEGTDFLEVQEWLMKSCRIIIDFKKHGSGPIPNSVGLIHLDIGKIEDITGDDDADKE